MIATATTAINTIAFIIFITRSLLYRVTKVSLFSQSATEKHNQEKITQPLRTSRISLKNVSAMFDNDTLTIE